MTVAERIEIRELYEFQLFVRGADGEPSPFGEPLRSLDRMMVFDDEHHGIKAGRWYALKRRRITLDDDGYAEYGNWSRLTEWKMPITSPFE